MLPQVFSYVRVCGEEVQIWKDFVFLEDGGDFEIRFSNVGAVEKEGVDYFCTFPSLCLHLLIFFQVNPRLCVNPRLFAMVGLSDGIPNCS